MVEKGDLESLRKSVTKENVNLQESQDGMTPLMSAASHGNAAMTLHLLAVGADTRVTGRDDRSAMHWAADKTDSVDVARLLLAAGAEADGRDRLSSRTPLMLAADRNHPRMLQLLLAHGADLNMRDKYGKTAQDLASSRGHSTCSSLLSAW
jgi:ankyrin repeat protein